MVGIRFPALRIGLNVFRDFQVSILVADNVLVIIALPNRMNIGIGAKPPGNANFESPHHRSNRAGCAMLQWPGYFIGLNGYFVGW